LCDLFFLFYFFGCKDILPFSKFWADRVCFTTVIEGVSVRWLSTVNWLLTSPYLTWIASLLYEGRW